MEEVLQITTKENEITSNMKQSQQESNKSMPTKI